ncbi:MAG: four helix bundle protein [Bacteroidetes bacterium]|nr:MAG: four helix bundle protein [Bacteroidota bacterium]
MFDFEKLEVYQILKGLNVEVLKHLNTDTVMDPHLKAELKRATVTAALELADGTARMENSEKKDHYMTARSNVFQSVALLEMMKNLEMLPEELYDEWYDRYTSVSKMLLKMYRNALAGV